jgi:hypothetical protein
VPAIEKSQNFDAEYYKIMTFCRYSERDASYRRKLSLGIRLCTKKGGDARIRIMKIEGSPAPRDIVKALSRMGNLAKVIAGRRSGTKSGAYFVDVAAETLCPGHVDRPMAKWHNFVTFGVFIL